MGQISQMAGEVNMQGRTKTSKDQLTDERDGGGKSRKRINSSTCGRF